jgi:hypothetical protein
MRRTSSTRLLTLASVVALLALPCLWPYETVVVPEWSVRTIDELGNPVARVPLRETWQHYSIESQGHEQDLSTNDRGYVTFPLRTVRANLIMRALRTTLNKINPHGSTGPSASVYVLSPYKPLTQEPYYSPGRPLIKQLLYNPDVKCRFASITSRKIISAARRH